MRFASQGKRQVELTYIYVYVCAGLLFDVCAEEGEQNAQFTGAQTQRASHA